MATATEKRRRLAERMRQPGLVVAPGIYDMISAKIADSLGFEALYMTGYGIAASYLGLPDAGLASLTDMVDRVRVLAGGTETPLIADADTGYGGLLNVRHTVRRYEEAGAAALQLEDQVFPKKCGHTLGRQVIPLDEMVEKIEVAVEARQDPNLLIIARTDARTGHGLDEALRRAEAFAAAGADVIFVESPESEAEMAEVGRRIDRPLLANMVEGGRTPILSKARLEELGFRLAIFPGLGFLAAGAALQAAYGGLKEAGSSVDLKVPLTDFSAFNKIVGFEDVWEFDRRHAPQGRRAAE